MHHECCPTTCKICCDLKPKPNHSQHQSTLQASDSIIYQGDHTMSPHLGDFFFPLRATQSVGTSLDASSLFSATALQIWLAVAVWPGTRCSTVSAM